jgi:hypothetical protein
MSTPLVRHLALFTGLAGVMALTRLHHFSAIPDASWAVFFAAGFALRGQVRWAFPLLMAVAVAVDYVVISRAGIDFWGHYCVSPGYWFLLPAHFALWTGGSWLATRGGALPRRFAEFLLVLLASVTVCHLFAQGGFYWFSPVVAEPTLAGWWKNYTDWLWPYLRVTGLYLLPVAGALALWQAARGARAGAASPDRA